jgi:hypothetical protein
MPLHGTGAVGFGGRVFLFGGVRNPARADPLEGKLHVLLP